MKPYVLVIALLFPALSLAQSPVSQYSSVVSVRELALPPKAARAPEKGTALLLKNNPQASVSYFQTAIALAPDSFHAYHNVAIAHYRLGDVEDAEQEFRRSIELSRGSFAPSLFALSMILYQRGEFLQAESLISKRSSRHTFVRHRQILPRTRPVSLLARSLKPRDSALDAIHLNPAQADGDIYLLLARIHERLSDPDAVVADVHTYFKRSRKRSLQADAQALLEHAQQNLGGFSTAIN